MANLTLDRGKKLVQLYPSINYHFQNFITITEDEYLLSDNIVIRWLKYYDEGGKSLLEKLDNKLYKLNELITSKNFTHQFISSYDNGIQSKNVWREIVVINYMCEIFGKWNLILYPNLKNGNVSDIKIDPYKIYIEIGDLQIPTFQQKVNEVVNNASIKLSIINKNDVYIITIDSKNLITNEHGYLMKNESTELIVEEVKKILDKYNVYDEIIRIEDDGVIKNIFIKQTNQNTVIIQPDLSSFAEETLYSESALVNKIMSHLRGDFDQLEENNKNVLWYFVDDFYSSIWFSYNKPAYLKKISSSIQGINPHLSGVVINQKSGLFSDLFYIPNNEARWASKLDQLLITKFIPNIENIII